MKIYAVAGVFKGVIDEVNAFFTPEEADADLKELRTKYEIEEGHEAESENDAKLFEIDIPEYPPSVAVRMKSI